MSQLRCDVILTLRINSPPDRSDLVSAPLADVFAVPVELLLLPEVFEICKNHHVQLSNST